MSVHCWGFFNLRLELHLNEFNKLIRKWLYATIYMNKIKLFKINLIKFLNIRKCILVTRS